MRCITLVFGAKRMVAHGGRVVTCKKFFLEKAKGKVRGVRGTRGARDEGSTLFLAPNYDFVFSMSGPLPLFSLAQLHCDEQYEPTFSEEVRALEEKHAEDMKVVARREEVTSRVMVADAEKIVSLESKILELEDQLRDTKTYLHEQREDASELRRCKELLDETVGAYMEMRNKAFVAERVEKASAKRVRELEQVKEGQNMMIATLTRDQQEIASRNAVLEVKLGVMQRDYSGVLKLLKEEYSKQPATIDLTREIPRIPIPYPERIREKPRIMPGEPRRFMSLVEKVDDKHRSIKGRSILGPDPEPRKPRGIHAKRSRMEKPQVFERSKTARMSSRAKE